MTSSLIIYLNQSFKMRQYEIDIRHSQAGLIYTSHPLALTLTKEKGVTQGKNISNINIVVIVEMVSANFMAA